MTMDIYSAALGDLRLAGASGGVACTTSAAFTSLYEGTNWLSLTPRNFSAAASVCRVAISPYLTILKTVDSMATAPTDYSSAGQDADSTTLVVLSSLNTLANGDCLYIGSHVPFRGVHWTLTAGNDTASVLTVKYWKDDTTDAWTDITATDGTDAAGDTFKQSGLVYWTVPSDWLPATLPVIGDTTLATGGPLNRKLYWTRWEVDAALDSSCTFHQVVGANASTAYAEFVEGQPFEERVHMGTGGIGAVESLTDAGTCNLLPNCATASTGNKFS